VGLRPLLAVAACCTVLTVLAGCGSISGSAGTFTPARPDVLTVATSAVPSAGFWEGTPTHPTGGFEYELEALEGQDPAALGSVMGGLIGGSIGLAMRERLGAVVAGFDPDAVTREAALAAGAADTVTDSVAAACTGAELVFCAAPVGRLPELAAAALAACGPDAAVTDVGSTKRGIVAAVGADERFIGGHPLAGAETAGVANARADLFEGARWYLTPTERSNGLLYDRLQRAVAGLGARPQAIDADSHDRLMATVSAMPHAVANALVAEAAADLGSGERVPEVGPSFRDATRVAGASAFVIDCSMATFR